MDAASSYIWVPALQKRKHVARQLSIHRSFTQIKLNPHSWSPWPLPRFPRHSGVVGQSGVPVRAAVSLGEGGSEKSIENPVGRPWLPQLRLTRRTQARARKISGCLPFPRGRQRKNASHLTRLEKKVHSFRERERMVPPPSTRLRRRSRPSHRKADRYRVTEVK